MKKIGLPIILALLALSVRTSAQNPSPSKAAQSSQDRTSQDKRPGSPVGTSRDGNQGAALQAPGIEDHNQNIYTNETKPDWWARIIELVAAAATIALAIIGYLGVRAAKDTLRLLAVQTKANIRAANAAKASADAIVKTERAWVAVSLEKVGPAIYHVLVVNHGRTIAKANEFRIAIEYSSGSGIPETTVTMPRSKILPPKVPWVAIELNLVTALGREIWERVEKYRIGFSYYGVLRYDDISDQPHETEFRFVYDGGVLTQVEAPIYNKHT